MDEHFPLIPKDLLEALEKRFPERCPDIKQGDREIWWMCGERAVIRFLRQKFEEQNETSLLEGIIR